MRDNKTNQPLNVMKLEDLLPFCSTDETRSAITIPFTRGNFTYATSGRIMIRVPAIEGVGCHPNAPVSPETVIPPAAHCYPVELPPGWQQLETGKQKCDDCQGSGRQEKCRTCKGEGEVECYACGHEHDCEDCRGTGKNATVGGKGEACEECDGEGCFEAPADVALNRGELLVDLTLLRLAMSLPNVRLLHQGTGGALRIEFEGGDGALMPLRRPYRDRKHSEIITEQWPAAAQQPTAQP